MRRTAPLRRLLLLLLVNESRGKQFYVSSSDQPRQIPFPHS